MDFGEAAKEAEVTFDIVSSTLLGVMYANERGAYENMLLTITYTGRQTTDLGYLLYKNPRRPQVFELNHGKAYVFYPEATDERTTAALLLDIDPIDLARGKSNHRHKARK